MFVFSTIQCKRSNEGGGPVTLRSVRSPASHGRAPASPAVLLARACRCLRGSQTKVPSLTPRRHNPWPCCDRERTPCRRECVAWSTRRPSCSPAMSLARSIARHMPQWLRTHLRVVTWRSVTQSSSDSESSPQKTSTLTPKRQGFRRGGGYGKGSAPENVDSDPLAGGWVWDGRGEGVRREGQGFRRGG